MTQGATSRNTLNIVPINPYNSVDFWIFLQVLARVATLIAIAPIFGAKQVPNQVKTGLAFVLTMALLPLALPTMRASGLPTNLYDFAVGITLNVAVGLVMGFVVSLIITAVEMAGSLLDVQVGFSMAQTLNPALGEMSAPIAQFQSMYALMLYLLAHGHYVLIAALARSLTTVNVAHLNFAGSGFLSFITTITFNCLVSALEIAAPAGAILVVIDFAFALLSRAVPQMNIFYVGMPVKIIAGLLLIILVLPLFATAVGHMVSDIPVNLSNSMKGAGGI